MQHLAPVKYRNFTIMIRKGGVGNGRYALYYGTILDGDDGSSYRLGDGKFKNKEEAVKDAKREIDFIIEHR